MSSLIDFERNRLVKLATAGATAAALVMALAVPAQASDRSAKSGHARWASNVELTPEQRAAMIEARREYREAASAARETIDPAAAKELRREAASRMRSTVSEVLTAEQLTEIRAAGRAHGERAFDRLAEELELHASQREPVREALRAGRPEGNEGRRSGRWSSQGNAEAVREELAGILTPAQLARWDARHDRTARSEQRLDRYMARLTDALELHASQVGPVRDIVSDSMRLRGESWRSVMEEARAEGQARAEVREAMNARGQALRTETHERLAGVLTPEQLAQYEALRSERSERQAEGRRDGGRRVYRFRS